MLHLATSMPAARCDFGSKVRLRLYESAQAFRRPPGFLGRYMNSPVEFGTVYGVAIAA
jgi:hypothetical protein